jgi:DNA polymerase-3 subunit beta
MKFRVERDTFANAVAWVARALPSRPIVPVLTGLRIEAGEHLLLSCFDYEMAASTSVSADIAEPGSVLVPGRLLADIIRSLPSQPVDVSSDASGITLTCGSAEFALVTLDLADYPELPEPPPEAGTIEGGELAAAAAQVLPAASRDDTLPMLTAVCLDIDGATMTLATTDRYRLAVRELGWSPARPDMRALALVPARTLSDAARAMAPGVPVTVSLTVSPERDRAGQPRPSDGLISFASGGRQLTGRLMGGEFIRYRSRFPSGFDCRAEIPAPSFIEAIRRVSLVADRASPVRLTFGQGRVVIEAQTEGRARAVESVTASFRGPEPAIAFNPQYLLDGVLAATRHGQGHDVSGSAAAGGSTGEDLAGAADAGGADAGGADAAGAPTVLLEFTSPAKPALITPGSDATMEQQDGDVSKQERIQPFRYLVVPLRSPTRA